MRKNRNTQNVNNTAAKSSKSSTATATRKSAAETYGIDLATAFRTIMSAIEASKGKESTLAITKCPNRGKVLLSCKGVYAPAVTNAIRKEANVIAGNECWQEADHCYRAWVKGSQRYEFSRDAWDAAEAAAKATEKPSRKRNMGPIHYGESDEIFFQGACVREQDVKPAEQTAAASTFTLDQVLAIAKHLRKGVKVQTIKAAITEVTGVTFAPEKTADELRAEELRAMIERANAELASLSKGGKGGKGKRASRLSSVK